MFTVNMPLFTAILFSDAHCWAILGLGDGTLMFRKLVFHKESQNDASAAPWE
jgi:hypothetical protein